MDRRVFVAARVRPMLAREIREAGEDHRPCLVVDPQVVGSRSPMIECFLLSAKLCVCVCERESFIRNCSIRVVQGWWCQSDQVYLACHVRSYSTQRQAFSTRKLATLKRLCSTTPSIPPHLQRPALQAIHRKKIMEGRLVIAKTLTPTTLRQDST
jgi:hypothetical protein